MVSTKEMDKALTLKTKEKKTKNIEYISTFGIVHLCACAEVHTVYACAVGIFSESC